MKTSLVNCSWRRGRRAVLVVPLLLGGACTDLTEVPNDALTPDNAFRTEEEILAGVASVYAGLRGLTWGWFNLNEVSTDEVIVPTRGSDWYDNGRWLEIYRQTWTASSGSALDDMNGTWNAMFAGVARANLMISVIENAGGASAAGTLAELRTLRAWYYYLLMDFFGGVPLVTSTEVAQNPRVSRDSIFKFVEAELNAARTVLPDRRPAAQYGRVTRGAADAILASMYLNAGVFKKDQGISATSYNSCNVPVSGGVNGCQAAVAAADRVINSGVYSLATDWKTNFSTTNEGSPENIFVVAHTNLPGLGFSLPMRTLHYNHLALGPWNGFATIAETYRAFDAADKRREIFLVGQQVSFNTGQPITDRAGNPLVISVDIANAEQAREHEGPRFNKFPPDPGAPAGDAMSNDFPFFRLAEMYLIKAEAQNEIGQTGAAITLVNQVRARQFSPAKPLAAGLSQAEFRTAILNERLFEFIAEAKRRADLVRHGKFTETRRFKSLREAHKVLFPIPSTQIQANPLLTQNPGY
ncbi:MAG: RagB/SusD family nutrient uptake outer membrane protein [Gemmatimonadaceae bacterium]